LARITFQKRQKEMKRLEKQRAKAERRVQKKLAKDTDPQGSGEEELVVLTEPLLLDEEFGVASEFERQS
jgi:hypothetical protein